MINFKCTNEGDTWEGKITNYKQFGSHHYAHISSKGSGISIYFGQAYLDSWFICIPDWNTGILIGALDNILYNAEKIGNAMKNEIDGISVAYALAEYARVQNIVEHDNTEEIMNILKSAGFNRVED